MAHLAKKIIHQWRLVPLYPLVLFFAFFSVGVSDVWAATLSFSPASKTITVGVEFDVVLRIDTRGQAINAIEGTMSYPATLLEGRSISTASSLITLWTETPTFNSGAVRFSGGRPSPGFTGQGEVFRVRFRSRAAGTATVSMQNVRVLLNDGNGTNVFESAGTGTYTIQSIPPPPPEPEPEPTPEPQPTPTPEPTPEPTPTPEPQPVPEPSPTPSPTPTPSGTTPSASEATTGPSAVVVPSITVPGTPETLGTIPVTFSLPESVAPATEFLGRVIPDGIRNQIVEIKAVVTETKIYQTINTKVVNNPKVEEVTVKIAAPAIVVTAAANVGIAVRVASLFTYLQGLATQPLLMFTRRRRRQWGIVYSSLTKLPIDLAVVRLIDPGSGRLLQTRVSDRQGRYLFLADPGAYSIEVVKPGFNFPSPLLRGKSSDADFTDLYHGGSISVTERSTAIAYPIPLDPVEKTETPRAVVGRRRKQRMQNAVAWTGPVFAVVSFIITPTPLSAGVVGLQFVLVGLFRRLAGGKKPEPWGAVIDARTKHPISFVVVRIFESQFNKLLETQVTDRSGRYAFLVGKGAFYITLEKSGYETYRSEVLDFSKTGTQIMKRNISLKPKSEQSPPAAPPGSQPPSSEVPAADSHS